MVVAVESKDFMRANETKMNGKSLTAVIMCYFSLNMKAPVGSLLVIDYQLH